MIILKLYSDALNMLLTCVLSHILIGGVLSNHIPLNEVIETTKLFRCDSGSYINLLQTCDGYRDCSDGADETIEQCKNTTCVSGEYFQCNYGACVKDLSLCTFFKENVSRERRTVVRETSTGCFLPEKPANGDYEASVGDFPTNSSVPKWTVLVYSCKDSYMLDSESILTCVGPMWQKSAPNCLQTCPPLIEHSLDIFCSKNKRDVDCNKPMLEGTIARVSCKQSYEIRTLLQIPYTATKCSRGKWDKDLFKCEAVCGTVVPKGTPLVIDGYKAYPGEFPWHTGIYRRLTKTYLSQICGGTLITARVVLTAAHCFWDYTENTLYSRDNFAVAAGKYHRDWEDENDKFAQFNDISDLIVPKRFRADESSYAYDIALLILKKAFRINEIVHPACIDWANVIYKEQFKTGINGLVAGWGLTKEDGDPAEELQTTALPFVDYDSCVKALPADFRRFITSDKICGGFGNGTSVCTGDSGGGFTFTKSDRHFIQGVVSVAATKAGSCDSSKYTAFTTINNHIDWIQQNEINYRGDDVELVGCDTDNGINCVEPDKEVFNKPCEPPKEKLEDLICTENGIEIPCNGTIPHGAVITLRCWYERMDNTSNIVCNNSKYLNDLEPCIAPQVVTEEVSGRDFQFINRLNETIWVGTQGLSPLQFLGGGFKMEPGEWLSTRTPTDNWSGVFWGRTRCNDDPFQCETGDCGETLECTGRGSEPPVTRVEVSLSAWNGEDYYDVSLVEGFNVPMSIEPLGWQGDGGQYRCAKSVCNFDILKDCPSELQKVVNGRVVACQSACNVFQTDQYCCRGTYSVPHKCSPAKWPKNYPKIYKDRCPDAYSYAYDDPKSLFQCKARAYLIAFG